MKRYKKLIDDQNYEEFSEDDFIALFEKHKVAVKKVIKSKLEKLKLKGYFAVESYVFENFNEDIFVKLDKLENAKDRLVDALFEVEQEEKIVRWLDEFSSSVFKELNIEIQMVNGPKDPNYKRPSWSKI